MTTIAYRNGIVASDSRMMCNGWKQAAPVKKLFRMADGSVCAVTGDYAISCAYVRWLESGKQGDAPDLGDGGRVVVFRGSALTVCEGKGSFDLECEFASFGSGSPAALAAMHMGADARKAVEIASLLDDATGGDLVSMVVGEL